MKIEKTLKKNTKPALIVHGGCGNVVAEQESLRDAACERAAEAGWSVLRAGGSALDAAEATMRALEDSLILNAGRGSYLQADGVSRRDASVMCSDWRAGAVVQVPCLRYPSRLARYILEQDAHIMLCGLEALHLGLYLGHELAVVATPAKVKYWQEKSTPMSDILDYAGMAAEWKNANPRLGTVGCVALDAGGHLAAATSTGGTGQCYPGRVGDTPVIGAGTYCTQQVGVSMTGVGERVLVHLSAKCLCDYVKNGKTVDEAAQLVLDELGSFSKGSAGLIALDSSGNMVAAKNTAFMACATRC